MRCCTRDVKKSLNKVMGYRKSSQNSLVLMVHVHNGGTQPLDTAPKNAGMFVILS